MALGVFVAAILLRRAGLQAVGFGRGLVYALLGVAGWLALYEAGVEPIVFGLALGLLAYTYPPARSDLERATDRFRLFREQPTPELAREARLELAAAIPANERLQQAFLPWTSYVIVPLFALANAGVPIDGETLRRAFTSPITLGILLGYVLGKPVGIVGATWLVTRVSHGRIRPPVGWAAVAGAGTIAGIGFTVSLLISTLAFERRRPRGGEDRHPQRGHRVVDPRPGSSSARPCCCHSAPARARSSAPRRSSSTSPPRSTPTATTSAARARPR